MQNYRYDDLANAIVEQAVYDYRKALEGKSCEGMPPKVVIKEVERFFHSSYFYSLTKVRGEYILYQLKKEHEEKERKKECVSN